eukprot:s8670_g1.t1
MPRDAQTVGDDFHELQGGKKEISARLQRITSQIAVASRIRTQEKMPKEARHGIIRRLDLYCSLDGVLDNAAKQIRTTWDKSEIDPRRSLGELSSSALKATQYDINALERVLHALIPKGEQLEEAETLGQLSPGVLPSWSSCIIQTSVFLSILSTPDWGASVISATSDDWLSKHKHFADVDVPPDVCECKRLLLRLSCRGINLPWAAVRRHAGALPNRRLQVG